MNLVTFCFWKDWAFDFHLGKILASQRTFCGHNKINR